MIYPILDVFQFSSLMQLMKFFILLGSLNSVSVLAVIIQLALLICHFYQFFYLEETGEKFSMIIKVCGI